MIGDIVSINTKDWYAEIEISGFATGGSYSMGLGQPYNSIRPPNTPKIAFSVLSSGFDNNFNPTTVSRTVYGLTGIRKAYPNNALKDESINANGNLLVRVSLSDYIYSKDSQITAQIGSGFYFNGASGNNSGFLSATNNSPTGYPKIIANWSCVPFERIVGSQGTLRCLAFHTSAVSGKPIRGGLFTVRDASGNVVSGSVLSPSIDSRMGDPVPIVEYVYDYPTASLTQGAVLTGNVKLYPILGTTGEIMDSNVPSYIPTGIISQPTQWFMPMVQFCDKNDTYGVTVAVVDPISGNNASGIAIAYSGFDALNPPRAFQTIHSGIKAIQNYNNTGRGRNDLDAGLLLLKSGNYGWMGGTNSLSSPTPKTHFVVSGYPNVSRDLINITGQFGTQSFANGRIRLDSVSIQNGSSSLFTNISGFWVNNCFINSTGGSVTFYDKCFSYFTKNSIKNLAEGFSPFGNVVSPAILFRGNYFVSGWNKQSQIYTVIGNQMDLSSSNNGTRWVDDLGATQTSPTGVPIIFAYNKILRWNPQAGITFMSFRTNTTSGAGGGNVAFVQNLIEQSGPNQNPAFHCGADQVIYNVDNIIIWNNTILGTRLGNINYNSSGGFYTTRKHWSFKNNLTDDSNMKDDTFVGEGGASGVRTGNFPLQMGCASQGNIVLELSGIGAAGFQPYFAGANTYWSPFNINPVSSGNIYGFTNRQAFSGDGIVPTGSGNYVPNGASAMLVDFGVSNMLPYDLAGNPRQTFDAGAYSYYTLVLEQLRRRRIILI
jgi:hypothetical protein